MIARALGALALAASVGFVVPWNTPPPDTATIAPIAAVDPATAEPRAAGGGWSLQRAVEQAFVQVLPDEPMQFALDTAQSSRVEGGGRRFEGSGIGTFTPGDARFIAFTMTLSARGEMVEFDYSSQVPAEDMAQVGAY